MTYEQIDLIADAYIPILAISVLLNCFMAIRKKGLRSQKNTLYWLASSITLVYLIMYIDQATGLWKALDSDYSTHTALALVFVLYWPIKEHRLRRFMAISLVLYLLLMWYQQYHTVFDMLSTAIVIATFSLLIYRCTLSATALETKT